MASDNSCSVLYQQIQCEMQEIEDNYYYLRKRIEEDHSESAYTDYSDGLKELCMRLKELGVKKDNLLDTFEWSEAICSINVLQNVVNLALSAINSKK